MKRGVIEVTLVANIQVVDALRNRVVTHKDENVRRVMAMKRDVVHACHRLENPRGTIAPFKNRAFFKNRTLPTRNPLDSP